MTLRKPQRTAENQADKPSGQLRSPCLLFSVLYEGLASGCLADSQRWRRSACERAQQASDVKSRQSGAGSEPPSIRCPTRPSSARLDLRQAGRPPHLQPQRRLKPANLKPASLSRGPAIPPLKTAAQALPRPPPQPSWRPCRLLPGTVSPPSSCTAVAPDLLASHTRRVPGTVLCSVATRSAPRRQAAALSHVRFTGLHGDNGCQHS